MREKRKNPRQKKYGLWLLFLFLMASTSCRLHNLEKRLSPEHKEFLSQTRYIITKEERKIFLEMPDSEKDGFIQEFWKRRDPFPDTEENEFKMQYFNRIEEANRLFKGGIPGWLQDRGRIYILFGPPTERNIYPMQMSSKPTEVWRYGAFPVVFVDAMGTGDFKIRNLNVIHQLEMHKAQLAAQDTYGPKEAFFDFRVTTKKNQNSEIFIQMEIDLKYLWFLEEEDKLETTLDLSVEVIDNKDQTIIMRDEKDYPLSFREEELLNESKYTISYPLKLNRGNYTVNLRLVNTAGQESRKKSLKIEIEEMDRRES
jgi:GWxTD domain-containing protein